MKSSLNQRVKYFERIITMDYSSNKRGLRLIKSKDFSYFYGFKFYQEMLKQFNPVVWFRSILNS